MMGSVGTTFDLTHVLQVLQILIVIAGGMKYGGQILTNIVVNRQITLDNAHNITRIEKQLERHTDLSAATAMQTREAVKDLSSQVSVLQQHMTIVLPLVLGSHKDGKAILEQ